MIWPAIFLSTLMLLFLLPLAPALVEWRRKRDASPLKIVQEYDGSIAHFATSFRRFVNAHFRARLAEDASSAQLGDGALENGVRYHVVGVSGEPDFTAEEMRLRTVHKLILSKHALKLPSYTLYEGEIYGASDIACGTLSAFRAILAEQDIYLDEGCAIIRWAHAERDVVIDKHARLFGRISAGREIILAAYGQFVRMHAPTLRFGSLAEPLQTDGFTPSRLTPLAKPDDILDESAQRWLTDGDLNVPASTFHRGNLVAGKNLSIGHGSFIMGNIKSTRDLSLEGRLRIEGAIVSARDLYIGPACVLKGPIVSEGKIHIASDTVIGSPDRPTTITAPEIHIAEGCVVHGTVWARDKGETTIRSET